MTLINVRVSKITDEADGIRSFLLEKRGFFKLPSYEPGAHIDVHCGEGIIRQYSLCGDPHDRRHYKIAVKQVEPSRGGSDLMHLAVTQGDNLEIGAPRNNFPLDITHNHTILLAAGIGITPIIAMADRLNEVGQSFELHYYSRGSSFAAFRERLSEGRYSKSVTFHDNLSVVQTKQNLREVLTQNRPQAQVYMCGPGLFMDAAESLALETRPIEDVHLERFAANPALSGEPTFPFKIELSQSGVMLDVGADETILEVLERNNINAAFSCEQGVCGTCVTEVLEGEPDHRDSFLSDRQKASNSRMCLCVSRAQGEKITLAI